MKVIVEAIITPTVWRYNGAVKLRIYANQSFFNSDGQYVPAGTPGKTDTAYLEIACTVLSGQLTIPSFEIDSTVDGLDSIWATYTAELTAGSRRVPFLANFAVNTLADGDPSTTWSEIINLHNMQEPQAVTESLSRQLTGMIQTAVGQLNKSSIDNPGVTAITFPPLDASFPIAVGANDPDWLALLAAGVGSWLPAYNAKNYEAVGDGVTDDHDALNALIAIVLAAGGGTIFFPAGAYHVASNLSFPAKIRLSFAPGAQIAPALGATVTILGTIEDTTLQIFGGQGGIRFTGNKSLSSFYHEWWGALGDGLTDDTVAIQRAWNDVAASMIDAIMQFLPRTYIIGGALQDPTGSNSQLVLPKRDGTAELTVFCLQGATPASTIAINQNGGTVLKSTLAAGAGSVIGVKTAFTVFGTLGFTYLAFHIYDLTIQTTDNPTLTGIDLSYVPNQNYDRIKIVAGGDATFTEPTEAGSYGIKTALNNVPDVVRVGSLQVSGFSTGIRAGELFNGDDVVINFCKRGVEIPEAFHSIRFGRLLLTETVDCIEFTGSAYVVIDNYDADHNTGGWWTHSKDIVDPSNLGRGIINAHAHLQSTGIDDIIIEGGRHLQVRHLRRAYISRYNYEEPFVNAYAVEMAVHEINSNLPVADNTKFAVLSAGTDQSGLDNTLFSIFANNYNLVGDRRVGIVEFKTQGAINSGRIDIATMDAGVRSVKLAITKNSIRVALPAVPVFANNTDALTGGLLAGDLYRTGADPDVICTVH